MLNEILTTDIYRFFLLFTRLGAAIMILPGIGGQLVPSKIRLLLALAIAFVLLPVLGKTLPALPKHPAQLMLLIMGEATIGVFFGVLTQTLLGAINTTGTLISFQTGLSNAFSFDAIAAQQSQLLVSFVSNIALVVIFAADMHHLMLRAVVDSYLLFPPGKALMLGDFSDTLTHVMSESFALGIRLASPIVVFGLVFYAALGLLSRLVPQMQVFFVAMPLQVLSGVWLLMVALPLMITLFLRAFTEGLMPYLATR